MSQASHGTGVLLDPSFIARLRICALKFQHLCGCPWAIADPSHKTPGWKKQSSSRIPKASDPVIYANTVCIRNCSNIELGSPWRHHWCRSQLKWLHEAHTNVTTQKYSHWHSAQLESRWTCSSTVATLQSLEEGQKKWEKPGIMNSLKEHQTLVTNPKACNLQIAWKSSKYGLKETQWDTRELKLIMPWNLGKMTIYNRN